MPLRGYLAPRWLTAASPGWGHEVLRRDRGGPRMYQFSRCLYRELGPLVTSDRYGTACDNRQHFLESCESAFQRLATDRHYFARPSRTLFNNVRFYFPIA